MRYSEKQFAARNQSIRAITVWGFAINLALTALKFLVGILGNSKSLVADAVHSLSDAVSDITLLIGLRYWSKPGDESHPYGHGKIENITGLSISLMLAASASWIIWDALELTHTHIKEPPAAAAFWVAVISIIAKEALYRWTLLVGKKARSQAVIANAWHHRSDALSSIVAAISIGIGREWEGFGFVDDVGAVVVAFILLQAAGKIAGPALAKLLDQAPPAKLREAIEEQVRSISGVRSLHALRMRYIGEEIFLDLHIQVDSQITVRAGHDIAGNVSNYLRNHFTDVADFNIHIEPDENT